MINPIQSIRPKFGDVTPGGTISSSHQSEKISFPPADAGVLAIQKGLAEVAPLFNLNQNISDETLRQWVADLALKSVLRENKAPSRDAMTALERSKTNEHLPMAFREHLLNTYA